jgi:hypothetical protein
VKPFKPKNNFNSSSSNSGDETSNNKSSLVEMRGSTLEMNWTSKPSSVLLVKKPNQPDATMFCQNVAKHIRTNHTETRLFVEPSAAVDFPNLEVFDVTTDHVDFVVCAG